jgi:hypothetical protein
MEIENMVLVTLFALCGGLLNSVLGWFKSNPPEAFNIRKFGASCVANVLGAAVIAAGYNYSGIDNIWIACILALLAGAGVVSSAKNSLGAIAAKLGGFSEDEK